MDCSTPGFPVLHCLPESAQTHVHWLSDAIPSSHPLSSLSPPAFNLSQHQGLFQESRLLKIPSGGQSIGASASASVLPMNIQGWFPLGLTGLISLQSKGLSRVFSSTTVQKHQFFSAQPSIDMTEWLSLSHICTFRKTIALTRQTFVGKVMSLLFNTLSRFVMSFLLRCKRLLISWLQSPSAVILEPKKIQILTISIFFPIYLPQSDGTRCYNPCFLNVEV